MALKLVTAPVEEPLELTELKLHLGEESDERDTLIRKLLKRARRHVEMFTRRQLMQATYDLFLDKFPGSDPVRLPRPPLVSVGSVKYYDADGNLQTLDSATYTVDTASEPGRLYLAYEQSWPSIRSIRHAVQIRFTAGYGAEDAGVEAQREAIDERIPQALQAVELFCAHWYDHISEVVLGTIATRLPAAAQDVLWGVRFMGKVDGLVEDD